MYAADYPRTPTFTPRAPTVMRNCIYTIRCGRARLIGPYAYGMYAAIVLVHQCLPTCTHCDAWLYLYNSCRRARWIAPYAYGMCAAIVYVQSMFTPRTRNIYPRTPTFTPRASTVGADLSCPHITEYTLRIVLVHQRLPTCTHCREPIYRARISRNIWCGHSLFHLFCFSFVP